MKLTRRGAGAEGTGGVLKPSFGLCYVISGVEKGGIFNWQNIVQCMVKN
ncbi:MAG: hypothetical protein HFE83_03750 [Lachnospiraceae bacterium]|nr:hypothetical protein [Lachnospiraceae bacterium]